MPEQIHEAMTIAEAESLGNGRYRVLCISEGKGSSGVYPRETLIEAANKRLIGRQTFAYLDHPSASEHHDRPERSVRDLAGVFTSEAVWDETHKGLVAEMQVFSPYRELIAEMKDHIGLSIRGDGEVEMREGQRTVTSLAHIESVDFVTRAGRGGKVLSVLESARTAFDSADMAAVSGVPNNATPDEPAAPAVSEAALSEGLDLPEPGDRVVIDPDRLHDPAHTTGTIVEVGTTAYGLVMDGMEAMGVHRWYTADEFDYIDDEPADGGMSMEAAHRKRKKKRKARSMRGMRMETRHNVPAPAGGSTITSTEETLMPQIEEGRLAQLEEAAGRVTALEAERDAAVQRAQTIEARSSARPLVAAKVAESKTLGARTQARLVESIVTALPVVDGVVADEQLTAAVESAVKAAEAEIADYQRPADAPLYGSFGSTVESAGGNQLSEADALKSIRSGYGKEA